MNKVNTNQKIVLLGVDGLSFPLIEKWVTLGHLPTVQRLMKRGCSGLLKPFAPSNSAVIWTSVMTGMNPRKHGIDSFIHYKIGERIISKTAVKRLFSCGARPLFRLMKKKGYIHDVPFSLPGVQQKMLWELFAQENRDVGVINWWFSWPASKVPGFIISDRIHNWRLHERSSESSLPEAHLVYPNSLLDEIKSLVVDPFDLDYDIYGRFMALSRSEVDQMKNAHYKRHQLMSEFKYLYAQDESVRRLMLFCLNKFVQPDFFALYFRGIDIISHCALKYAVENRDPSITDEEAARFGRTVYEYYQYLDSILGEIINSLSPGTNIMIVSDHGFEREPDGRFGHRKTRPPGLFIVSGPQVKAGLTLADASLYDIAPTILYLAGLPLSHEMDGSLLRESLEEPFLNSHPVHFVSSYGTPERKREVGLAEDDEQIKERLRALGYID
jgi:predicted AlkP superfamily phosphohydrolase/phosphomutase